MVTLKVPSLTIYEIILNTIILFYSNFLRNITNYLTYNKK